MSPACAPMHSPQPRYPSATFHASPAVHFVPGLAATQQPAAYAMMPAATAMRAVGPPVTARQQGLLCDPPPTQPLPAQPAVGLQEQQSVDARQLTTIDPRAPPHAAIPVPLASPTVLLPPADYRPQPADQDQQDRTSKGSISMLQEFVQCSWLYQAPQQRSILQWDIQSRSGWGATSSQFRATVSFLLDGVPHHVVGAWHLSKKSAQRDTADRTLGLYVGKWGAEALRDLAPGGAGSPGRGPVRGGAEAQVLEEFCRRSPSCDCTPLRWEARWEDGLCAADVRVVVHGVPHTFSGTRCAHIDAARADTARRVLWYLQCPGFQQAFEVDPQAPAVVAPEIPAPPAKWLDFMDSAPRVTDGSMGVS